MTESGIRGAADLEHVEFSLDSRRVIVTSDRDFLRLHQQGQHHAGIVFVSSHRSVGESLRGLFQTTVSKRLQTQEVLPRVEFRHLRLSHLDGGKTSADPREEQMTFEDLVTILKNYIPCGYPYMPVNDVEVCWVQQTPSHFAANRCVIASLVLSDDAELQRRVLNPTRDCGFRDCQRAVQWNGEMQDRPLLPQEHRIDDSGLPADETAGAVLSLL